MKKSKIFDRVRQQYEKSNTYCNVLLYLFSIKITKLTVHTQQNIEIFTHQN